VLQQVIQALVESRNEAADDVLLEALRLGNAAEKSAVLEALIERKSARGLGGVIGEFDALAEGLKLGVLRQIKVFHSALRQ